MAFGLLLAAPLAPAGAYHIDNLASLGGGHPGDWTLTGAGPVTVCESNPNPVSNLGLGGLCTTGRNDAAGAANEQSAHHGHVAVNLDGTRAAIGASADGSVETVAVAGPPAGLSDLLGGGPGGTSNHCGGSPSAGPAGCRARSCGRRRRAGPSRCEVQKPGGEGTV